MKKKKGKYKGKRVIVEMKTILMMKNFEKKKKENIEKIYEEKSQMNIIIEVIEEKTLIKVIRDIEEKEAKILVPTKKDQNQKAIQEKDINQEVIPKQGNIENQAQVMSKIKKNKNKSS